MKNLPIRVGDRVRVRQQRWSVVDVRPYEDCHVLTLDGIGPLNAGIRRAVIAPFDAVQPIEPPARLRIVRLPGWRRRCRALLAARRSPCSLTTAAAAAIDLMPHQLEPAIAVLGGLATRVLIADDVGLGKTVQAGLILSELRARGAVDRALVLAPAGLRDQWAAELHGRLGLDAVVLDMPEARRRSARLPLGVNPWATLPLVIASLDFVKRPEVLPAVSGCRWDLLIVDEAHGVAPGSDRHRCVTALSERTPYVVLLTATPHSGDRPAFESLCALGSLNDPRDRLLVFRRTRRDVASGSGRRVHALAVRASVEEMRMQQRLARFTQAVRAEHGDCALALATLHKRALSSAHALRLSIERRLAGLDLEPGDLQLALPFDDDWGELDRSDCAPSWTAPPLSDAERERRLLEDIASAARDASRRETKLAALVRLLARLERRGEPVVVFTEYRDTLQHVRRSLADAGREGRHGIAVLHGGLARDERSTALEEFRQGRRGVLLATDAGGEGLNLHLSCRVVVNLELPWNPMRLEQRIGRVDRIGQRRRVHAFNLLALDAGEGRILDRLKDRLARARLDIDVANPLAPAVDDAAAVLRLLVPEDPGAPAKPHGPSSAVPAEPGLTGDALPDRQLQDGASQAGRFSAPQRLARAAAEERARLDWVRRLLGDAVRGEPSGVSASRSTWLAFARRADTRARLAPGVLVLLRRGLEDRCGRELASEIVPLVVEPAAPLRRGNARGVASALVRVLEGEAAAAVDPSWLAVHRDFWNTRMLRELRLAECLQRREHRLYQAGLFDRPSPDDGVARARLEQDIARRLAMVAAIGSLDAVRDRVALILVP